MELTNKVVDSLYVEAMVLSDEARAYFDTFGHEDRDRMTPLHRVSFSCESLKVTTRLMHVIAWLLSRRANQSGLYGASLAKAANSDRATIQSLPEPARQIIGASEELYARIARLDGQLREPMPLPNAAHGLMSRLESVF
jgi:regulator of CtrA degradation